MWTQDRTGMNVLHRAGCSHLRLDPAAVEVDAESVEQAIILVAADNCDPEIVTVEDATEWVSVSRCLR